jgi:hypothetical protein
VSVICKQKLVGAKARYPGGKGGLAIVFGVPKSSKRDVGVAFVDADDESKPDDRLLSVHIQNLCVDAVFVVS